MDEQLEALPAEVSDTVQDDLRVAPTMANPEPIGVEPRWIWDERRAHALIGAIRRYDADGRWPNPEWATELGELLCRIHERANSRT